MLFNKDWDKSKTDPHSLKDLIAWLETKRPDEKYDYISPQECLIGLWLRHCDKDVRNNGCYTYTVNGKSSSFEDLEQIVIAHPRTFGAALERAKDMEKINA